MPGAVGRANSGRGSRHRRADRAGSPAKPVTCKDSHRQRLSRGFGCNFRYESLRKVLAYVHADIIDDACLRIEVTRDMVGAGGTLSDPAAREAIADALGTLARRRRECSISGVMALAYGDHADDDDPGRRCNAAGCFRVVGGAAIIYVAATSGPMWARERRRSWRSARARLCRLVAGRWLPRDWRRG